MKVDSLARIVLDRGRPAEARRHHGDSLKLAQELGSKVDTADALDGLARVAVAEGDPERGLVIAGAAQALHDRIGYPIPRPWRRRLQVSIDSARAALGPEAANAAWERGMRLKEREAVLVALGNPLQLEASSGEESQSALSTREREVAALIAAGLANKQVANQLKISERTVDAHVEHIRTKLQIHSRAQIALWATRHGLMPAQLPAAMTV